MLLDALNGDRAAATDWLVAGGADALRSWGLDPDTPREQWAAVLPAEHVAFLRGLALSHREGEYFFVHAGIRPGV
jgi:serine/threonine protein phosphatase 1